MKNVYVAIVIVIAIVVFVGAAFIFLRLQSSESGQVNTEPQEATTEPRAEPGLEEIESTEAAPQEGFSEEVSDEVTSPIPEPATQP